MTFGNRSCCSVISSFILLCNFKLNGKRTDFKLWLAKLLGYLVLKLMETSFEKWKESKTLWSIKGIRQNSTLLNSTFKSIFKQYFKSILGVFCIFNIQNTFSNTFLSDWEY